MPTLCAQPTPWQRVTESRPKMSIGSVELNKQDLDPGQIFSGTTVDREKKMISFVPGRLCPCAHPSRYLAAAQFLLVKIIHDTCNVEKNTVSGGQLSEILENKFRHKGCVETLVISGD